MIAKTDRIVTAYAQPCAGPGWSNTPLWVIVRGEDGNLREECIQPTKQTADMFTLYRISAATHTAMVSAVERALSKSKKGL